jgi:UPF0755 protein
MKKSYWVKILIALSVVVFFIIIAFLVFKSKAYNSKVSDSNVTQIFEIEKNEGAKLIGKKLEEENLVKNKYYFYYQIRKENLTSKLQVGKYELSPNMTVGEIMAKITAGEVKEVYQKLIIPEGFTNAKIVERIKEIDLDMAGEFEKIVSCEYSEESELSCKKMAQKYKFLENLSSGVDMEGYLFPDTYFIYSEDDALKLVNKFLENFESKITKEMLNEIAKQNKNLHQIMTLASIVEKEVRSEADMKKVAGLFWRRTEDEYLLQSCATLAYIIGEDKKQYSIKDTKIESIYNTYLHPGLPPGPVSNPGLKSIEASIFPEKNDYYFFLSDPKTGETIFSKTLDEHNLNKSKYGL